MDNSKIGIKIADGTFFPILEDEASGKKKLVLTTVNDDQSSVQIDLYKGAGEKVSDAAYIGSLVIEDVMPAMKGEPEIELIIGIDEEGNLNAEAGDSGTNERQSLSVSLESLDEDAFATPNFELDDSVMDDVPPLDDDEPALEDEEFGFDEMPDIEEEPVFDDISESDDDLGFDDVPSLEDDDLSFEEPAESGDDDLDFDDVPSLEDKDFSPEEPSDLEDEDFSFDETPVPAAGDADFDNTDFDDTDFDDVPSFDDEASSFEDDLGFDDDSSFDDEPGFDDDEEDFGYEEESSDYEPEPAPEKEKKRGPFALIVLIIIILAILGIGAFLIIRSMNGDKVPELQAGNVAPAAEEPAAGIVAEAEPEPEPEPEITAAPEVAEVPAVEEQPAADEAPAEVASQTTGIPPQGSGGGVWYRLKWGDTLWDLSNSFYRTPWLYKIIAVENNIKNPDIIYAGDDIHIPEN